MNIGSMIRGLLGESKPGEAKSVELKEGQIVRGVVLSVSETGKEAVVQIQGTSVRAELETPLQPGQTLNLQVAPPGESGLPVLKPVSLGEAAMLSPQSMGEALEKLGLANSKAGREIVQAMQSAGVALTPETAAKLDAVMNAKPPGVPAAQWLEAAVISVKRGLPVTAESVKGLQQAVFGPQLHQLLSTLEEQLTLWTAQMEESPGPAANSGAGGKPAASTAVAEGVAGAISTGNVSGEEGDTAAVRSGQATAATPSSADAGEDAAAAKGLAAARAGEAANPEGVRAGSLGAQTADDTVGAKATGVPGEATLAGRDAEAGARTGAGANASAALASGDAEAGSRAAPAGGNAQAGGSAEEGGEAEAGSRAALARGNAEAGARAAVGGAAEAGSRAALAGGNAEAGARAAVGGAAEAGSRAGLAGRNAEAGAKVVAGGAAEAGSRAGLAGGNAEVAASTAAGRAAAAPGGAALLAKLQGVLHELRATLPQLAPTPAASSPQEPAPAAAVQQPAGAPSPTAETWVGRVLKLLGAEHEQLAVRGAGNAAAQGVPAAGEAEGTLKGVLLQVIGSSEVPPAVKEAAGQLVQQLTGQQLLLNTDRTAPFAQVTLFLPLNGPDGRETASVHIQSRRGRKGELDAANCRLWFDLDMKQLGQTLVDVQVVDRMVNLKLHNNEPWVLELLEQRREEIKSAVESIGYQLSGLRTEPLPELSAAAGAVQAKLADYVPDSYQGVDFRI
ncbi:hypothetical protein [Paenibacillus donghaensis]|uniref:Uncharacterized protein n=1 Tax=Paenibacillus donghaensis TaxID=414771 RepID=A0A2Z2KMA7_9BACL|nr:hypothetical protein [Paenibacillus donghaensis]ASA22282.1 hypothetical protein B9T62_16700 [Paenibacillus donghaensis]